MTVKVEICTLVDEFLVMCKMVENYRWEVKYLYLRSIPLVPPLVQVARRTERYTHPIAT
jgi:short-subunit dehydrogenase involved in D-alanine esterification of teichoic acids